MAIAPKLSDREIASSQEVVHPSRGPAAALDVGLRSELAVRGVRVSPPRHVDADLAEDGHWWLDGRAASLPLAADSPWSCLPDGTLTRDRVAVGVKLVPLARPRFYDLQTADGVPYWQLARLHAGNVLATTVVQTCVRYGAATRCRFCTIEEPLRAGTTTAVKHPDELAAVAQAAVRLDGARQLVMMSGTSNGLDRGARHLAHCAAAVRRAVPRLPIQVQIEPPAQLEWIRRLRGAGATAIAINVESLDQAVRRRWTPGKATVPLAQYEEAWREAVGIFGRNRVSTNLVVGLGEDPDELVAGAERLIAIGVYPFVVPYRPLPGSLAQADGIPAPNHEIVADVTDRVARALRRAEMRGADQRAGCAACGACSTLAAVGG